MKTMIKLVPVVVLAVLLSGCASMFTSKTDASYVIYPDGRVEVRYSSDKEQVGLEAEFRDVKIKVDKASTQESVIAAVLQLQLQMVDLLKSLAPVLSKAAIAGS